MENPFMEGMGWAQQFRQALLQEAQYRHRLEQDRRNWERQERIDKLTELQVRLNLAKDPALQEVPEGAGTRRADAYIHPDMRRHMGGAASYPLDVPVEAPIEYGGKRYAVRGREERFGEKMKEAEAMAQLEAAKQGEIARQKVVQIPGRDVPYPAEVEEQRKRLQPSARPPTPIPGRDVPYPAEVEEQRKRLQRTPGAAGGEGTLAWKRYEIALKKQRLDELTRLEALERAAAAEVSSLRILATEGETDADKKLAESKLRNKEAELRRIREEKVKRGFTTAEDAGLTGTKQSPKKGAKTAADPLGIL